MNREEAARVLKAQADYYGNLFASMVTAGDYSELRELETRMEALEVGAAALRGPQPDPITGLVPCGCGGPEWMRTADRLPTAEDGVIGATGEPEVLAVTKYAHGYFPDMKMVSEIREALGRKYYPYWMALPKLPEVEG